MITPEKQLIIDAIIEFEKTANKLIGKLLKEFDINPYQKDPFSLFIIRTNNLWRGSIQGNWNYRFHGGSCEFINSKTNQFLDVFYNRNGNYGVIDYYFLFQFIQTTPSLNHVREKIDLQSFRELIVELEQFNIITHLDDWMMSRVLNKELINDLKNFTLELYTKYLCQYIPEKHKSFLSESELEKSYESEFNFIEKRIDNLITAEKFREICKIKGAEITDYRVRIVKFEDYFIVASIRFMGLDVTKPFVEIEFHSNEILNFISHLPQIKSKLLEEFKIFNCKHISLKMSDKYLDKFRYLNPILDKPIYAIPLEQISKNKIENKSFNLEKIDVVSEEDYNIYAEEYKLFNQENPHLFSVHAEPYETINEKAKSDFVFKVIVDNQWAGLCMYVKDKEYFYHGYLVWDKIIFKKYRGQNLSAYVQDYAFQDFIPRENGFIFGYIDPENLGSIKTAEKTGRESLVGFYLI